MKQEDLWPVRILLILYAFTFWFLTLLVKQQRDVSNLHFQGFFICSRELHWYWLWGCDIRVPLRLSPATNCILICKISCWDREKKTVVSPPAACESPSASSFGSCLPASDEILGRWPPSHTPRSRRRFEGSEGRCRVHLGVVATLRGVRVVVARTEELSPPNPGRAPPRPRHLCRQEHFPCCTTHASTSNSTLPDLGYPASHISPYSASCRRWPALVAARRRS
jgi:hypothetical protein